jgi:hypothetical protein
LSWIVKAGGQLVSAGAAKDLGKQQKAIADDEALQLEQAATGEVAAATFNANRIRKRAEEIMSSNRAKAAKGGGDTTDASVLAVQAETVRNSTVDQLMEMAAAQERAKMMRRDAAQTRAGGKIAQYESKLKAWGNYVGATTTVLEHAESAGWGKGK